MRLFWQQFALATFLASATVQGQLEDGQDTCYESNPPRYNSRNIQLSKRTDPSYCKTFGRNVTLQKQSSCREIAITYNIGDYQVIDDNPWLSRNGTVTPSSSECVVPAGTTLCLEQPCNTYVIQKNDTCLSIAANAPGYKAELPIQLDNYNPELGNCCANVSHFVGDRICVSINGVSPPNLYSTIFTPTALQTQSTAPSTAKIPISTLNSPAASPSSPAATTSGSSTISFLRCSSFNILACIYLSWALISCFLVTLS